VKCWVSVYLGGSGLLVLPAGEQVIVFLSLVGNLAFLFFGGEANALLLSGTVGSTGPLCFVGSEASWPQK
jgi:hypothetical protein